MYKFSSWSKLVLLCGLVLSLSLGGSGCAANKPKLRVEITITIDPAPSEPSDESGQD